jgi:hypothetical protein
MTALRFFARFLLALALLASGQTALVHPIEHVDEHGHFVHLYGNDGQDARGENDSNEGDPSQRLGESLATLTACAAGTAHFFPAGHAQHDRVVPWYKGAPRLADAPPFLSQGPPASV